MEPCQGGSRETRSLYLAEAKVFHMAPQVDAQLLTWLVELKAIESADAAPSHASLTTTLERHQVEVIQSGEVRLGCLQPRIAAHVTRIGFRPSSSRAWLWRDGAHFCVWCQNGLGCPDVLTQRQTVIKRPCAGVVAGKFSERKAVLPSGSNWRRATVLPHLCFVFPHLL
jgi:hypothetical protein